MRNRSAFPRRALASLVLLVAALAVVFADLGANAVIHGDEALYGLAARNMAQGGELLIPRLDGEAMLAKAPLTLWGTALSYRLGGVSEFTTRLFSALCSVITVLVVARLSVHLFRSEMAGLLAGLILLLNPGYLFVHCARNAEPDSPAIALFTLAVYAYVRAREDASGRWLVLAAVCCALTSMAKTITVGFLPAAVIGLHFLLTAGFRQLSWRSVVAAVLAFVVVVLPWHVAAYLRLGDAFLESYFWQQTVDRLEGASGGETNWEFRKVLVDFAPFSLLVALSPMGLLWKGQRSALTLCLLWMGVVTLAVAQVEARLPWYIFPAYPAAALAAGFVGRELIWPRYRWPAGAVGGALVALALVAQHSPVDFFALSGPEASFRMQLTWAAPWLPAAAVGGVAGAMVAMAQAALPSRAGRVLQGLWWVVLFVPLARAASGVSQRFDSSGFQTALSSELRPFREPGRGDGPALYFGRTMPHLSERFYLEERSLRRPTPVEYLLGTAEDLIARASDPSIRFLFVAASEFTLLRSQLLPTHAILSVLPSRCAPGLEPWPDTVVVLGRRPLESTHPTPAVQLAGAPELEGEARARWLTTQAVAGADDVGDELLRWLREDPEGVARPLAAIQWLRDASLVPRLRRIKNRAEWGEGDQLRATCVLADLGERQGLQELWHAIESGSLMVDSLRDALVVAFRMDFLRTTRALAKRKVPAPRYRRLTYFSAGKARLLEHVASLTTHPDASLREYAISLLERPDSRYARLTEDEKRFYQDTLRRMASSDQLPELQVAAQEALAGFLPSIWNTWVPDGRKRFREEGDE